MFHGRLLREASEAKEITMGRISTRRLFVFLTTFLCVVAANVRDVKGRQDFTWKLFNDLNIKVGADSAEGNVTLDTMGRFLGEPILLINFKVNDRALKPVFLRIVEDDGDFEKENEAFLLKPKAGTRSQLRFKSKEITNRLGNKRGPAKIDVQVVMAHKEDDRWIVDERLTNAVSRPLSTTNIGVVVLEVQEGSPATRMINIEDGTAWKLEAGDIITHIDGARFRPRSSSAVPLQGSARSP